MIERQHYLNKIKLIKDNPVVALIGPRQVGKTTLARTIAMQFPAVNFFDLEDPKALSRMINLARLSKHIVLMLMCFLMCIPVFAASMDAQQTKRLQKLLDDTRNKYHFSAMALTVMTPQSGQQPMNFLSGTTEKNHGRPLRVTDYFQIGSNTKSFVAALLLKLQSENKISLEDKVSKWLPKYTKWNDVTILNLLNNNSGIPSYTMAKEFFAVFDHHPEKQFSQEELINYAYSLPVLFKPAHGWDYSNTNWIVAGMIAEKAGGDSLDHLFKKYFFEKYNLVDTKYIPTRYDAAELSRLVHGYDDEGKDIMQRNMSWASSAGAIIASTQDLARWTYVLFHDQALNQHERVEMQQIVSTKTGKNLTSSSKEKEGYGLGVGLRQNSFGKYWGHEGHTEGFHSIFAYFPEQNVTIAMNADGLKNADFQVVLKEIMDILKTKKA